MEGIEGVGFGSEGFSQRLPCVLVLDGSGSMEANDNIGKLNEGLKFLAQDLNDDDVARQRVRLLAIRVGGAFDVDVVTDWTDAINYTPVPIIAEGLTPLGRGVNRALAELEEQKRLMREEGIPYNRPWLFIITDGEPTDNGWQTEAAACKQAEADGKVSVFCIGVDDCNFDQLGQFSSRPPVKLQSQPNAFKEFFLWLSASAKTASKKAPGEKTQMAVMDQWAEAPG